MSLLVNSNGEVQVPDQDLQMALQPYNAIFFAIAQVIGPMIGDREIIVKLGKITFLLPGMPPEALGMPIVQVGIRHPGEVMND